MPHVVLATQMESLFESRQPSMLLLAHGFCIVTAVYIWMKHLLGG